MSRNLQERMLVRIVSLSGEGNSQRQMARILVVSQGCHIKFFATQLRHWSATLAEA